MDERITTEAGLFGRSTLIEQLRQQVEEIGPTDQAVLITGEGGTHKDWVARAVHAASRRAGLPFRIILCRPADEPFPSEAFRRALISAGNGSGTLLLARIDSLRDGARQVLRELIESFASGSGQEPAVSTDKCRWIATSNGNPRRSGVLDWISSWNGSGVAVVDVPPLRERLEDIPLLADLLIEKHAAALCRTTPRLSKEALELLLAHSWPANLREFENAVERAVLVCAGDQLEPQHFFLALQPNQAALGGRALRDVEQAHIERVLLEERWNMSRSARVLGIDRTTLYNKLRKYGLR